MPIVDGTDLQLREQILRELTRGDLTIRGAFDLRLDNQPPAGAEARILRKLETITEQLRNAARLNRPNLVLVLEIRPTREALERVVQELRAALEACADDETGWPTTGVADTFEESRELVPEDLPDDDDEDEARRQIERETQASFYPRSRYGPKL